MLYEVPLVVGFKLVFLSISCPYPQHEKLSSWRRGGPWVQRLQVGFWAVKISHSGLLVTLFYTVFEYYATCLEIQLWFGLWRFCHSRSVSFCFAMCSNLFFSFLKYFGTCFFVLIGWLLTVASLGFTVSFAKKKWEKLLLSPIELVFVKEIQRFSR